jgi:hypothetical protein
MVENKSLYISREGRHFYGTKNEIWAGFGSVGNTEKKFGADYEQLLRVIFFMFSGEKSSIIFFLNIVASALKCCIK